MISASLYPADFRRSSRENVSQASIAVHGEKEPDEINAGWLNTTEMACDLRDVRFDWNAEQRLSIRFSTTRFVDAERGMVFPTDADLDGLMAFPRKGSNGSWADRLWCITEVRQHLGAEGTWHQDVVAVELGAIGSFAPVAPPVPPAAFSMFATWKDTRAGSKIFAGGLDGNGSSVFTANGVQVGNALNANFLESDICPDGAGGSFVAFTEVRNINADVFIQRLTATGAVASGWPATGVQLRSGQAGSASVPRVVPDGLGGAIVAWEDRRGGASAVTAYAQRVSAAGTPQWTVNGVNLYTPSTRTGVNAISLASDNAGGAFIALATAGDATVGALVQRLNASGAVQYGAAAVSAGAAATVGERVAVVPDGVGGCYVFTANSNGNQHVRRFDGTGATPSGWVAGGVVVASVGSAVGPVAAVSDDVGGVIVFWVESSTPSNLRVFAQRVDAAAAIQWAAGGVQMSFPPTGNIGTLAYLNAVRDTLNGAVLAWSEIPSSGGTTAMDVYAQRVNGNGALLWPTGVPLCNAAGNQVSVRVARDGTGGYYFVWEDQRTGFTQGDLFAQRVDASGVRFWTGNGITLAAAANVQNQPRATSATTQ